MDTLHKLAAGCLGALLSFFTGFPPLLWALMGVMTLDYITGMMAAALGKSPKTPGGGLSSRMAFEGLMRKCAVLLVVLLAWLLDYAAAQGVGVPISAVTGIVCAWFIASEGLSVLENAAVMGLPIPSILTHALEGIREKGGKDAGKTPERKTEDEE